VAERRERYHALRPHFALTLFPVLRDNERNDRRRALMARRLAVVLVVVSTAVVACQKSAPTVDWSAKENFFLSEDATKNDDGSVRLEYHSLVDAPADGVYAALAEPENYVVFVDGVTDSGKISQEGSSRVVHLTQNVIGRQNRAEVKYTFYPDKTPKRIEFETLRSDVNFNDGYYEIYGSPDGKRTLVVSIFNVREKTGLKVPPGVLMTSTKEAFVKAATSVKKRALGQSGTKTG
jgi:hypothetical protein